VLAHSATGPSASTCSPTPSNLTYGTAEVTQDQPRPLGLRKDTSHEQCSHLTARPGYAAVSCPALIPSKSTALWGSTIAEHDKWTILPKAAGASVDTAPSMVWWCHHLPQWRQAAIEPLKSSEARIQGKMTRRPGKDNHRVRLGCGHALRLSRVPRLAHKSRPTLSTSTPFNGSSAMMAGGTIWAKDATVLPQVLCYAFTRCSRSAMVHTFPVTSSLTP
jgi:hypothetical protein